MQNYIISDAPQWTEEWLKCRAGRITGTRLKSVMSSRKSTRTTLIHELIAEKLAPLPEVYQSGWMERWHRIEEVVKKLYGENSEITIESVGFITRTDVAWIGISPDGIIRDDDGKIIQAVEVKAPSPKVFVEYFLNDEIPSEYFWQVVHYFVVLDDLENLDFIIYNPDFYSDEIRMKKWTISRENLEEKILQAKNALAEFYVDWSNMAQKFIEKTKKL